VTLLNSIGEIDKLKVYVVAEDCAGYESPLLAQHGISMLLETYGNDLVKPFRILFDVANNSEALLYNMKLLGIDPKKIDAVVISHCHWDHTGGLMGVLNEIKGKNVPVIAHPSIFRPNFVLEPYLKHEGVPYDCTPENIESLGFKLILTRSPMKIVDGIVTSGEIERKVDFEKGGVFTYTIANGEMVPDEMMDDMALIVNVKNKGLLVFTGCGHAGIVNTVLHAMKITGVRKVHAVFGGFHLLNASEERIRKTAEELKKIGVEEVYSGHCTGFRAHMEFYKKYGEKFHRIHSGYTTIF